MRLHLLIFKPKYLSQLVNLELLVLTDFKTLSFLRKKRQRCVQLFGGLETISLFIDS
jgi:hypothetical protein